MDLYAIIVILAWILITVATANVTASKGRSYFGGFLLGLFFGPIGLMVALLLSDAPML